MKSYTYIGLYPFLSLNECNGFGALFAISVSVCLSVCLSISVSLCSHLFRVGSHSRLDSNYFSDICHHLVGATDNNIRKLHTIAGGDLAVERRQADTQLHADRPPDIQTNTQTDRQRYRQRGDAWHKRRTISALLSLIKSHYCGPLARTSARVSEISELGGVCGGKGRE